MRCRSAAEHGQHDPDEGSQEDEEHEEQDDHLQGDHAGSIASLCKGCVWL